jgi:hypothetical protein
MRTDQTYGAGILWILGDVLGLPFLLLLMRALSADDKAQAARIDEELDQADQATADLGDTAAPDQGPSTLWWENDPQLRERFGQR